MTAVCPFITTSPRPWGAVFVVQNDGGAVPVITTGPRPWGATFVVENGTNGAPTTSPRPWGATFVVENGTNGAPTTSPRPWGATFVIKNKGCIDPDIVGSPEPVHTTSPRPWGGMVVVASDYGTMPDDTNRMTDDDWREEDWTRYSDAAQLLTMQAYIREILAGDHSNTTGAHATRAISSVLGYATYDGSPDLSAAAVYDYSISMNTTSAGAPVPTSTFYRQTSGQGTLIESVPGFDAANNSTTEWGRVLRKMETGNATGTTRTYKIGTSAWSNYLGATHTRAPDYTPFLTVGHAVTKNHYAQAFQSCKRWFDTFHVGHDQFAQHVSKVNSDGLGADALVTVRLSSPLTGVGTTYRQTVMAHAGAFISPLASLRGVTAFGGQSVCVIRPAFDDANCYVNIEQAEANTPSYVVRLDVKPLNLADSTAPTVPSFSSTNNATQGKSTGVETWTRIQDNNENLTLLYQREHDSRSGAHKLPVQRFTGATILSGSVTVPGTVGDWNATVIESLPASDKFYFPPAAVGASGSGIVEFSIGFDDVSVYLIARRLTAGTTNSFTYKVARVDDA